MAAIEPGHVDREHLPELVLALVPTMQLQLSPVMSTGNTVWASRDYLASLAVLQLSPVMSTGNTRQIHWSAWRQTTGCN